MAKNSNKSTYSVLVEETLARYVEVEAESAEDALRIVEEQYDNEEVVLDSGDFVAVDFRHEEMEA